MITIKDMALATIEGLILARCPGIGTPDEELLNTIYTFAHIASDHCDNKHPDWVHQLERTYKQLQEDEYI